MAGEGRPGVGWVVGQGCRIGCRLRVGRAGLRPWRLLSRSHRPWPCRGQATRVNHTGTAAPTAGRRTRPTGRAGLCTAWTCQITLRSNQGKLRPTGCFARRCFQVGVTGLVGEGGQDVEATPRPVRAGPCRPPRRHRASSCRRSPSARDGQVGAEVVSVLATGDEALDAGHGLPSGRSGHRLPGSGRCR